MATRTTRAPERRNGRHRQRSARALAGCLLLALLGSCSEPPLASFRWEVPADEAWTERKVPAARAEFPVLVGPARDGVAATVRVARTRWQGSLLAFVRQAERELAEGLDGWRLLQSEPFLTDAGQQGQRIVGELPDGPVTLRVAQHVLREDGTIFVLTATRAAGDDPEVDAVFARVVASVRTFPADGEAVASRPHVVLTADS